MGQRVAEIRELGSELVGISVSPIYAQQAFAQRLGIDFPLLSGWGGETVRDYGVEYDVWKGHERLAKRSIFVIDRDGKIAYRWVTEDAAVQPDLDDVITCLRSLWDS